MAPCKLKQLQIAQIGDDVPRQINVYMRATRDKRACFENSYRRDRVLFPARPSKRRRVVFLPTKYFGLSKLWNVLSPPTEGSSFGHAPSYQPNRKLKKKCDKSFYNQSFTKNK